MQNTDPPRNRRAGPLQPVPRAPGDNGPRQLVCSLGHIIPRAGYVLGAGCPVCRRLYDQRRSAKRAALRAANPPKPRPPATHCQKGHDLSVTGSEGKKRRCRVCRNDAQRRLWHAKKHNSDPPVDKGVKKFCVRGHEYTAENTRQTKRFRMCLTCLYERKKDPERVREPARRPKRTHCKWGHAYAGDNLSYYRGTQVCRACRARIRRQRYWGRKGLPVPPRQEGPATHCRRGHEYTLENTGQQNGKWRYCKVCYAAAKARARARTRELESTVEK